MRIASGLAVALLAFGGCAPVPAPTERAADADRRSAQLPLVRSSVDAEAIAAGRAFLARHLADDGRIVRRDQGGDTVSEGQAYGMLIAAGTGDRRAFDRIWSWTQQHLVRSDGLLSWRWDDGRVVDDMPAADADVDAAHALVLAADRFDEQAYAQDAAALARAVLEHEVVDGRDGPVLVAGPWAIEGRWVNPSYASPAAFAALASSSGNAIWEVLDDGGRRVVSGSTVDGGLPPDWAVLTAAAVEPRGAPSGGRPEHGYDAARTAVRWAVDCDDAGPPLAAAMVDEYVATGGQDGTPPAVLALDGRPRSDHGSPLMTVAHAAAQDAAGDHDAARRLLRRAAEQTERTPTYYGDAWVALGRLWLTTDRLGGCAALS